MLHRLQLPFATNLAAMLQLIAERCAMEGRPDLSGACLELAAKAGAVRVDFKIEAVTLLCAACDMAHQRGDDEMRAQLEALVALLKQGKNALITGTIQHVARTPGELDGALEGMRTQMIRAAGG